MLSSQNINKLQYYFFWMMKMKFYISDDAYLNENTTDNKYFITELAL